VLQPNVLLHISDHTIPDPDQSGGNSNGDKRESGGRKSSLGPGGGRAIAARMLSGIHGPVKSSAAWSGPGAVVAAQAADYLTMTMIYGTMAGARAWWEETRDVPLDTRW